MKKSDYENLPALFFLLLLFSCSSKNEGWQKVETTANNLCTSLSTHITTNHQGEHTLTDCSVFVDNDTLYIHFPAALPAYWLGTEVKVVNGMFKTEADGIPFVSDAEFTYQIKKQQLHLNKQRYAVGDTLQGYVDIIFKEEDKAHHLADEYYFKGCISQIIRTKDYQPFKDNKAIMAYDLELAINELGEPLNQILFNTSYIDEFRIELLNIFPPSDSIYIRELTWNTSDDAQISNGGIYRLTIWYAQKDGVWKPVHFLRWSTDMQF